MDSPVEKSVLFLGAATDAWTHRHAPCAAANLVQVVNHNIDNIMGLRGVEIFLQSQNIGVLDLLQSNKPKSSI